MIYLRVILLSLLMAGVSFGQKAKVGARPQPVEVGHRYLFVIEVSKNMERFEESILETTLDLVGTGMHGDMLSGDAFTMWLYRDRVGMNLFQPEIWFSDTREQHAQAVGEFVSQLKYDAKADLNLALDEIMKLVAASKSVTIFLINDGSQGMTGTPFDLYANTFYKEQASEYRKQKQPFVTAFLAVDGKIIDCVISPGGSEVKVPNVPASLRHLPEYAKPSATNTPTADAKQAAPKSKPALSSQIQRPAPTPKATPPAKPRSDVAPVTPPPVKMSLGPLAPRELPGAPPASTSSTPTPAAESKDAPPPDREIEPAVATFSTTVATESIDTPMTDEQVVHTVPRHWWVFIGSGFLLCAVWIGWLIVRVMRPARGPSLITRSLEEDPAEGTP